MMEWEFMLRYIWLCEANTGLKSGRERERELGTSMREKRGSAASWHITCWGQVHNRLVPGQEVSGTVISWCV